MTGRIGLFVAPTLAQIHEEFRRIFGVPLVPYTEDEADDADVAKILHYMLNLTISQVPGRVSLALWQHQDTVAEFSNPQWTVLISAGVPADMVESRIAMLVLGPDSYEIGPGGMDYAQAQHNPAYQALYHFLTTGKRVIPGLTMMSITV